MKVLCMLACVALVIVGLSSVSPAAVSRLRVKSSPYGRHVHTHEHHVGRTKSCAGSVVGAARFGVVWSSSCAGSN